MHIYRVPNILSIYRHTHTHGKAATVTIATNSFRKCGIWPFNSNIFEDHEYASSIRSDRPISDRDHSYARDDVVAQSNESATAAQDGVVAQSNESATTTQDGVVAQSNESATTTQDGVVA